MTVSRIILVAGLLAAVLTGGAIAHNGASGIVKERMDAMEVMSQAVKRLAAMMRGDQPYNASAVKKDAAVIRSHAGGALTKLFPKGSSGAPSEARPAIWSDWRDFSNLAEQLRMLADGLGAAANNGAMMSGGNATAPGNGMSSMMGTGASGMTGRGGSTMMNGAMMGRGRMGSEMPMIDPQALAAMPAEGVFNMVTQTCSACHTKFRLDDD